MSVDTTPTAEQTVQEACSPREFAARLGVSTDAVRDMIDRGEISHGRVGRLIRIPVAEISRILYAGRGAN